MIHLDPATSAFIAALALVFAALLALRVFAHKAPAPPKYRWGDAQRGEEDGFFGGLAGFAIFAVMLGFALSCIPD